MEQADFRLCGLVSRGVPMKQAREMLGIPEPVDAVVEPVDAVADVVEPVVEPEPEPKAAKRKKVKDPVDDVL